MIAIFEKPAIVKELRAQNERIEAKVLEIVAENERLRAALKRFANDTDDCVSPGMKGEAEAALGEGQ